jgi:hypothetical protein
MVFLGRAGDIPTSFQETYITSGNCPGFAGPGTGITPTSYPAWCVAPMNSTAIDPDFNSFIVMASDDTVGQDSTPWDVSWGSGSSGGVPRFTTEETLLLLTGSNGFNTIINVNPTAIHYQACTVVSPCVSPTGLQATNSTGDSTHLITNANLAASLEAAEPYTFLEQNGFTINKIVISCSVGHGIACAANPYTSTISRTLYADFVNGTGSYGGVFPPITVGSNTSNYFVTTGAGIKGWSGLWIPSNNDCVGFGLGGGYDWLPNWTPADVVGNTIFIWPGGTGHAWQAISITGPTGSTPPVWANYYGGTVVDGGVTWNDVGGSLGSQGPGFDIVQFCPNLGYSRMNTRLMKIYRGSGNSAPAGLATTNDPVACTRATGAPCTGTQTVTLTDKFTLHDTSQDRDDRYWTISATGAEGTNPPGNWNSGTLTCQNSGGSFVWAGAYAGSTSYVTNQVVSYTDPSRPSPFTTAYYAATANTQGQAPSTNGSTNANWTGPQEAYCPYYIWAVATTLVQPSTAWQQSSGHGGGGVLYSYHGGKYLAMAWPNPSIQLNPPNGPISLNPGTALLATGLPDDDHPTYLQADPNDHQPPFSVTEDIPSNTSRYAAGYNEIVAFNNVVTQPPPANYIMYRFAHEYTSGCSGGLGALGTISPQGDLLMWNSDWLGNRNVQNKLALGGGGVKATMTCQATKAVVSMALTLNENVFPISGNSGLWVYQVTSPPSSGTAASSMPTWCQTQNCIVMWGTGVHQATLEAIGNNNGRGDVGIVDLLSAQIAGSYAPSAVWASEW